MQRGRAMKWEVERGNRVDWNEGMGVTERRNRGQKRGIQ